MENQHRKIAGYRELSQGEIDLMNEIKAFGPQLQTLCAKIDAHIARQERDVLHTVKARDEGANEEFDRLLASDPKKWATAGYGSLQIGLMFLTRAVAQPGSF